MPPSHSVSIRKLATKWTSKNVLSEAGTSGQFTLSRLKEDSAQWTQRMRRGRRDHERWSGESDRHRNCHCRDRGTLGFGTRAVGECLRTLLDSRTVETWAVCQKTGFNSDSIQ